MKWTQNDIPDQTGRVAIVTGANTGIGYETARALVHKGANATIACRNKQKGEVAAARIDQEQPRGTVRIAPLDLADLESVRAFADGFTSMHERLDLLVNNAGVMVPPESTTAQGFELQFGVNHLGHFALTGRLFDLLRATSGARVVTISSAAHRMGAMDFDDLQFTTRGYQPWPAYGQSKLANLLFTFELQRRFEAEGLDAIAVAAHPGWTSTDLQRNSWLARAVGHFVAMRPAQGALPTLRAATAPDVRGGEYYGPHGFREMRGFPVRVATTDAARNPEDAARLWQVSEALTGVHYGAAPRGR